MGVTNRFDQDMHFDVIKPIYEIIKYVVCVCVATTKYLCTLHLSMCVDLLAIVCDEFPSFSWPKHFTVSACMHVVRWSSMCTLLQYICLYLFMHNVIARCVYNTYTI